MLARTEGEDKNEENGGKDNCLLALLAKTKKKPNGEVEVSSSVLDYFYLGELYFIRMVSKECARSIPSYVDLYRRPAGVAFRRRAKRNYSDNPREQRKLLKRHQWSESELFTLLLAFDRWAKSANFTEAIKDSIGLLSNFQEQFLKPWQNNAWKKNPRGKERYLYGLLALAYIRIFFLLMEGVRTQEDNSFIGIVLFLTLCHRVKDYYDQGVTIKTERMQTQVEKFAGRINFIPVPEFLRLPQLDLDKTEEENRALIEYKLRFLRLIQSNMGESKKFSLDRDQQKVDVCQALFSKNVSTFFLSQGGNRFQKNLQCVDVEKLPPKEKEKPVNKVSVVEERAQSTVSVPSDWLKGKSVQTKSDGQSKQKKNKFLKHKNVAKEALLATFQQPASSIPSWKPKENKHFGKQKHSQPEKQVVVQRDTKLVTEKVSVNKVENETITPRVSAKSADVIVEFVPIQRWWEKVEKEPASLLSVSNAFPLEQKVESEVVFEERPAESVDTVVKSISTQQAEPEVAAPVSVVDASLFEQKEIFSLNDAPLHTLLRVLSIRSLKLFTRLDAFIQNKFGVYLEIGGSFVFFYAFSRIGKLSEREHVPNDVDLIISLQYLEITDVHSYVALLLWLESAGFFCTKYDPEGHHITFQKKTETAKTIYENNLSIVLRFKHYESVNCLPLTQNVLRLNSKTGMVSFNPGNADLTEKLCRALHCDSVEVNVQMAFNPYQNLKCYFSRLIKFYRHHRRSFDSRQVENVFTQENLLLCFFRPRFQGDTVDKCYYEIADLITRGYFSLPESSAIIAAFVKVVIDPEVLPPDAIKKIVDTLQQRFMPQNFNYKDKINSKEIIRYFYNELVRNVMAKFGNFAVSHFKLMAKPSVLVKYEKQLLANSHNLLTKIRKPVFASRHQLSQHASEFVPGAKSNKVT